MNYFGAMYLQVLSLLITTSLLALTSCNNNAKADTATSSWRFFILRESPKAKVGKQMPPHPEPDAVLINVGENGQPGMPGGGFPGSPGRPGIFGPPRDPGVFGFPNSGGGPGVNTRPNVYGIPQSPDVYGIPQGPDVYGIPQGPDVYGMPQGPAVFGMPRLPGFPDAFGIGGFYRVSKNPAGFDVYGSGSTGVFVGPQAQLFPMSPGLSIFPPLVGQKRPGIFAAPNGPLQPGELDVFRQRGGFAMPGNVNIPLPSYPDFYYPGRVPNSPGGFPETFVPPPGERFPGAYYPDAPIVPNQPGGSSDGNFPRTEGTGGREVNDEPAADSFPLIDTSKLS